jgi:MFS family permease
MQTNSNPRRWAALPVLLAGAFMVVLDFFIVNVALPSMAADLEAARARSSGSSRATG